MTDAQIAEFRTDLRDGFRGVHERLDSVDARLRAVEQDVAVLKAQNGRKAMVWGGGSSASLIALVEGLKALFK